MDADDSERFCPTELLFFSGEVGASGFSVASLVCREVAVVASLAGAVVAEEARAELEGEAEAAELAVDAVGFRTIAPFRRARWFFFFAGGFAGAAGADF